MLVTLLMALAVPVPSATLPEEEELASPYVILVDGDATSVEALFERYPELATSFEGLAKFNLLRTGRVIEVPPDMLASNKTLAKVKSFFGEAEVKRSFDNRYVPLVPNLLLREGDELRTWRGAGVRISFDDGNYVFLKSQSRARILDLGDKNAPATSRLAVELAEGGVWSEIERPIKGRYEIRTPTASTIIRGTEFRVKVEAGDLTRLEVLDGEVELTVGDRQLSVGSQRGALATTAGAPPETFPLPPAPELMAPLPEEVIREAEFDQRFSWAAVPSAQSYVVEIARDREFFELAVERRVTEPTARVQSLEPGTYFWRVSVIDHQGFEGSPSESRYFVHVERRP